MEGFSRNYIKKASEHSLIKDAYDLDVENAARKAQKMEARSYTEFAGKKEAFKFIQRSYSVVAIGFLISAASYPLAVRIVKKTFKLKSFFNINFAALPIILNANAFVLGITQGYFNFWELSNNYSIPSTSPL